LAIIKAETGPTPHGTEGQSIFAEFGEQSGIATKSQNDSAPTRTFVVGG